MVPSPLLGGPHEVLKSFRFQIDGANDPNFQVPARAVDDVVRTSTGLFTITLPVTERYPVMISCTGSVQTAAASGGDTIAVVFTPVSYTASTGVLVVRTENHAGTADDPADNDWVHVQATFSKFEVTAPTGAIPA